MITLATLPTATAQQVFDQGARHLLTQMAKSATDNICLYRTKSLSLSCAAGCFIADEEYKSEMENETWGLLLTKGFVPSGHQYLIRSLQTIHDCYPVSEWRLNLKVVADSYDLDDSVLYSKEVL